MSNIDNNQDIIDSRDIIERLEELDSEHIDWLTEEDGRVSEDWEHSEEFEALRDLAEQAESSPDWQYGEALIRDTYFTEYTKDMIEDCYHETVGQLDNIPSFIAVSVDWEETADNCMADYIEVNYSGATYYIRG